MWNSVTALPDVLIGGSTFSYFQLRLTHRPWGPCWINLYSSDYAPPQVSRLGSWIDALAPTGADLARNEYGTCGGASLVHVPARECHQLS